MRLGGRARRGYRPTRGMGTDMGVDMSYTEGMDGNAIGLSTLAASIQAKLDFLWIGAFSGHNLLSDLGSIVITVTGKDFSATIPYTSAATLAVPNNATFIADDTDYIWFKTDATQRQTTPLELVSYDLPRTLVKYEDTAPYNISRIAIIKSGAAFTTAEWEEIYEYFHLPIFWDDTYNDYGYMKENRLNPEQYVWTPEDVVPNGDCTDLVATVVSDSEISLVWVNGSTNEDGIKIERSLNDIDWTVIHSTAAGVETYSDTGLDDNTLYYYRVRAFQGALYSNYSNTDSATTDANIDIDAQALINRMIAAGETPDTTRQILLSNTFVLGKTKAFWTKLDACWLLAAHGTLSSRMNILDDDHNCTLSATAPVFEVDRGWTTASAAYLLTDFNPAVDGVNFLQNSAGMGYYDRLGNAVAQYLMGGGSGTIYVLLQSRDASGRAGGYMNANSPHTVLTGQTGGGLTVFTRTGANATKLYGSAGNSSTDTDASTGVPNLVLYIGRYNNSAGNAGQFAFAFVSGALTDQDKADIQTVFVDGYLASIGAKL